MLLPLEFVIIRYKQSDAATALILVGTDLVGRATEWRIVNFGTVRIFLRRSNDRPSQSLKLRDKV